MTELTELTGKFKLETSENFDNFLKELGMNRTFLFLFEQIFF